MGKMLNNLRNFEMVVLQFVAEPARTPRGRADGTITVAIYRHNWVARKEGGKVGLTEIPNCDGPKSMRGLTLPQGPFLVRRPRGGCKRSGKEEGDLLISD